MKQLTGHTSPETAFLVEDYPYGFKLRCQIRFWIETTKHGQRFVSQTTNPKKPGVVWNKPKASTYSPVRVMYLDDAGHVQNTGLSPYASLEEIEAFTAAWPGLDEAQRAELAGFLRIAKASAECVAEFRRRYPGRAAVAEG